MIHPVYNGIFLRKTFLHYDYFSVNNFGLSVMINPSLAQCFILGGGIINLTITSTS